MTNSYRQIATAAALATLLSAPLWAQSASAPEDPVAKQRAAVAAMQESLARQQAAVQKQMGAAAGGNFFTLPRASSMGTNASPVPAPAPILPLVPDCDPLPTSQVDALVGETAQRDGVSADLLRSVMRTESGFRPCAVSSKGAMGLMQLMPGTAEDMGVADPFDAASNLDGGARFLRQLLKRYDGDMSKALGAYNAGPAKVDAAGAVPAIPETVEYVRQILGSLPLR